jgi:uncharacterized protein HemX
MQPAAESRPAPRRRGSFLLVLFLLVVAFLGGYVPQWWQARGLREQLQHTELQLQLANAHQRLGIASHEVQRNNFASASQAAAEFFDQCGTLARTDAFAKEPRTQVALTGYAQQRDEVMAQLAAADPAVRERLSSLYLTMQGVLERRALPAE